VGGGGSQAYPYVAFEEGGEPELLQFGLRATVVSAFLQVNPRYSHTLRVAFSEGHLDRAKEVIRRAPGYEEDGFRWPVENGEVTFSSKDNRFCLRMSSMVGVRTIKTID
jgi:hypothetical protein